MLEEFSKERNLYVIYNMFDNYFLIVVLISLSQTWSFFSFIDEATEGWFVVQGRKSTLAFQFLAVKNDVHNIF
jgi:hypothetical protein